MQGIRSSPTTSLIPTLFSCVATGTRSSRCLRVCPSEFVSETYEKMATYGYGPPPPAPPAALPNGPSPGYPQYGQYQQQPLPPAGHSHGSHSGRGGRGGHSGRGDFHGSPAPYPYSNQPPPSYAAPPHGAPVSSDLNGLSSFMAQTKPTYVLMDFSSLLMLLCLRTIIIPTTLPRSTNSPSIATSRHTGRLSSRSSNSHSSSRSRHSSSRNRSRRHSLSLRRRNSHIYRTILRILTSKVDHPISHGGPLGRRVISLLDLSLVAGVDAAALMETVADTRLQQPWAPPFASDLIAARSSLLQ